MIILAIDPGETTGVAVCTVGEYISTFNIISHNVISKWRGVETLVDNYSPDIIVAESYRLYPHLATAQAFSTMVAARVLGAIEEIAERRGIRLVEQAASIGTKLRLPDDIFQKVGRYWTPHEKEAVKHAVAYCYSLGIKE